MLVIWVFVLLLEHLITAMLALPTNQPNPDYLKILEKSLIFLIFAVAF
jgi:hypothetical protein